MEIVDIDSRPTVPRHADGRPKVFRHCEDCGRTGRVPGVRANTTKKCPTCAGEGRKGAFYTRMTTFIDCLEDKSNLSKWKQRIVLLGVSKSEGILEAFRELRDPMGEDKQKADALVGRAEDAGDAGLKAKFGDALHEIAQALNEGKDPGFIPDEFAPDIWAYREALRREGIVPVLCEAFVVNDKYQAAGSFDALVLHYGKPVDEAIAEGIKPKLKISDLKTGRIDYGRAKIGMQLGGYSESELYSPEDFSRKPLVWEHEGELLEVDQEEALIIHLPAGEGFCEVVPVDIGKARKGLQLAWDVRQWRKEKFQDAPTTEVTAPADLC